MPLAGRLRMTTQRRVILEELSKLKTHPTAAELCQIVRKRLPRISLGTVYRNLEVLSREGIIQKLEAGGQQMRFDGNVETHYHLRCLVCGRVADVDMELLSGVEEKVAGQHGFQVLGHHLEFFGVCPQCRGGGRGEERQRR